MLSSGVSRVVRTRGPEHCSSILRFESLLWNRRTRAHLTVPITVRKLRWIGKPSHQREITESRPSTSTPVALVRKQCHKNLCEAHLYRFPLLTCFWRVTFQVNVSLTETHNDQY